MGGGGPGCLGLFGGGGALFFRRIELDFSLLVNIISIIQHWKIGLLDLLRPFFSNRFFGVSVQKEKPAFPFSLKPAFPFFSDPSFFLSFLRSFLPSFLLFFRWFLLSFLSFPSFLPSFPLQSFPSFYPFYPFLPLLFLVIPLFLLYSIQKNEYHSYSLFLSYSFWTIENCFSIG